MSLTIVATPIGDFGDITLRAIETLRSAEVIICEELKPAQILFKRIGLEALGKHLVQLNEHARESDLAECLKLCREKKVALISDCGTPAFCDPGAVLVDACVREKIQVDVNPGPSSLMTLLSIAGVKLDEFFFVGFLPAEKSLRTKKLDALKGMEQLKNGAVPIIVMDTPYRLRATLSDFALLFPKSFGILGIDLTGAQHKVVRDEVKVLAGTVSEKAPFVLVVFPKGLSSGRRLS